MRRSVLRSGLPDLMYPIPAECSESVPSCIVSFAYTLIKI